MELGIQVLTIDKVYINDPKVTDKGKSWQVGLKFKNSDSDKWLMGFINSEEDKERLIEGDAIELEIYKSKNGKYTNWRIPSKKAQEEQHRKNLEEKVDQLSFRLEKMSEAIKVIAREAGCMDQLKKALK